MDDTAAGVWFPSRFRATARAFRSPPSRTRNRSDKSGMPRAGTAKSIACRDAAGEARSTPRPGLLPRWNSWPASLDHLPHREFDFGKWRVERRPARVDHDVPLRPEFGAVQAERFPDAAFNAVTDHGSTDCSRHRE